MNINLRSSVLTVALLGLIGNAHSKYHERFPAETDIHSVLVTTKDINRTYLKMTEVDNLGSTANRKRKACENDYYIYTVPDSLNDTFVIKNNRLAWKTNTISNINLIRLQASIDILQTVTYDIGKLIWLDKAVTAVEKAGKQATEITIDNVKWDILPLLKKEPPKQQKSNPNLPQLKAQAMTAVAPPRKPAATKFSTPLTQQPATIEQLKAEIKGWNDEGDMPDNIEVMLENKKVSLSSVDEGGIRDIIFEFAQTHPDEFISRLVKNQPAYVEDKDDLLKKIAGIREKMNEEQQLEDVIFEESELKTIEIEQPKDENEEEKKEDDVKQILNLLD